MKKIPTHILKATILLIAVVAFITLLWMPQTEGRAANLDLIGIYSDPFIIYAYIASIPFFVALFQAVKLLDLAEKNKIVTKATINAVRNIKFCALSIICFLVGAMGWIRFTSKEDSAGFITMAFFLTLTASVTALAAAVFQEKLSLEK